MQKFVEFADPLGATTQWVDLPPTPEGLHLPPLLTLKKREKLSTQLLFVGHADTVFTEESPFQTCEAKNGKLYGPGVADMKGGLIVLLHTLLELEKDASFQKMGWEIVIVPDEEIGSPSSRAYLEKIATQFTLGLVFEPALPDGSVVMERGGSKNFLITAKGETAHVGRDPKGGKSALLTLARLTERLHSLSTDALNVHVGTLHSGEVLNAVPDQGELKFNVRSFDPELFENIDQQIKNLINDLEKEEGVELTLELLNIRPPKPANRETRTLYSRLKELAHDKNIPLELTSSGGVSDANTLEAVGLPTLDTLGVVGGHLHTTKEYMEIASLAERADLTKSLILDFLSRSQQ